MKGWQSGSFGGKVVILMLMKSWHTLKRAGIAYSNCWYDIWIGDEPRCITNLNKCFKSVYAMNRLKTFMSISDQ